MIRSVRISGFKRFRDAEFRLPGHAVLTGPNDTGKTTLLQAVASWALALRRWRDLGDFKRRNGYRRAPITRQAFFTVPLRSFELLWLDRRYRGTIEIELRHDAGWSLTMEFIADTTEQIYVRPGRDAPPDTLREVELDAVFVPPMTGVGLEEPLLLPPTIEHILSLGRPGEVLRNLLADACANEPAWDALQAAIGKLFGYRLLPPDTSAAYILADYVSRDGHSVTSNTMKVDTEASRAGRHFRIRHGQQVPLDIASAGRGFQQVLMLLALLNTRPGAVVLLDEPDAHLHPILQYAVYRELKSVATRHGSQLVAATNSEVLINAVNPSKLIVMPADILEGAQRRPGP